jgi:hypothetical protein
MPRTVRPPRPTSYENGSDRRLLNQAQAAETAYLRDNPWVRRDGGFIVNAGIAKESYFANRAVGQRIVRDKILGTSDSSPAGLFDLLKTDVSANAPAEQSAVSQLWGQSSATKGMFVYSALTNPLNLASTNTGPVSSLESKYGFQFHYNPTTIQMAYAANADFDVTQFTSGKEAFNLLGANTTQSTLAFTIILNRINDMKYFNAGGSFKAGVTNADWAGKFPTLQEQRDIYNKGTMYDIEFFLRTILQGIATPAGLRQRNSFDGKTADLGFLTGIPVEVHLGRALRYWVRVDQFSLTHVIFNERMVPMFTEVNIVCSRIPDYGGTVSNTQDTPPTSGSSSPSGGARYGVVADADGFYFDPGLSDSSGYVDQLNG